MHEWNSQSAATQNGEGLEAKTGKDAGGAGVPRIRNEKRAGLLMEGGKAEGFLGLGGGHNGLDVVKSNALTGNTQRQRQVRIEQQLVSLTSGNTDANLAQQSRLGSVP